MAALRDAVDAIRDRGYPVWIGGTDPAVREVAAAHADGWNRWGGGLNRFREQAANLQAAAARSPFTRVVGRPRRARRRRRRGRAKAERLGAGDHVLVGGPDLVADALRAYVDAGAEWLMIGPVDSSDPDNARILGEEILPRSRLRARWYRRTSMEFRRINALPPYVFGIMDALKIEARRAGVDVVDLGFGNPDVPSPDIAVEKLAEAVRNPRNHRYSASRGIPKLRMAVADLYERKFGVDARPRHPGVQHHRRQGGLLPPHVGAARAR